MTYLDRTTILRELVGMAPIRQAIFPEDAVAVLDIWREFIASPSVSLEHQNKQVEFDDIPGKYAAPKGCVLLADRHGEIDGIVALKPVDQKIREMKRL